MSALDYTTECTYNHGISLVNPQNFSSGDKVSGIIDVSKYYRKTISIYCYSGSGIVDPQPPVSLTDFYIETSNNPDMSDSIFLDQINIVGNISDMNFTFNLSSNSYSYSKISFFDNRRYVRWGFTVTSGNILAGIRTRIISFAKFQSRI